ncbi:hypothetical protein B5P41_35670, partial [Bacillus sp. SRB_28]
TNNAHRVKFNGFRISRVGTAVTCDYIIDSGANVSVTNNQNILINYEPLKQPVQIQACNGQATKAYGKGILIIQTAPPITIKDVLYAPI